MPFINVKVNIPVSPDKEEQIKSALGQAISAIPGKSENWLMVEIESAKKLWFKGSSSPCAMVDVSIFGKAAPSDYEKLTGKICSVLDDAISVSPSRTYVKYNEVSNWGWNSSNF